MKVALVYDRVNKWGGAERVLLVLHELFPEAPLYTAVYNPQTAPWARVFSEVIPSFLQNLPYASLSHELYAPLMPLAFESFNFDDYDLVISVTSEAAKGIITKPGTIHICYCLTPTRYLWSGYETYFPNGVIRTLSVPLISYLKTWDKIAAQRSDVMVGISETVRERIKRYYGREAGVVYPPVELAVGPAARSSRPTSSPVFVGLAGARLGTPARATHQNYFLIVSRLVPYKRVDLAIEAFNRLELPLVVVGTGREEGRLKRIAKPNIHFVSHLTDSELARYYEKAQALIFPQEEDFGIVVVEAQMMGIPAIAYQAGGAEEIVIPGKTGEFFSPQTVGALVSAVQRFDKTKYSKRFIVSQAQKFTKKHFVEEFRKIVGGAL